MSKLITTRNTTNGLDLSWLVIYFYTILSPSPVLRYPSPGEQDNGFSIYIPILSPGRKVDSGYRVSHYTTESIRDI